MSNATPLYDKTPFYDMPSVYDCTIPKGSIDKVSSLKYFLRSCLELMKYETPLNVLCVMIDQCTQER
jgi:hypothetical protein